MKSTSAIMEREIGPVGRESAYSAAWQTVFPDEKKRKEPRFPFCFQIQVRWLDGNMHPLEEHTNTVDISKTGCRFGVMNPVPAGAFLAIAVQGDDGRIEPETAVYSAVWCRREGECYEVGAELVDGPNLWKISFPEAGTGSW